MGKPYSVDLRERVASSVEDERLSRRRAAARLGVSYSAPIDWVKRHRQTGSPTAGRMGGHKPKKISGAHRDWLVQRCRGVADPFNRRRHASLRAAGGKGLAGPPVDEITCRGRQERVRPRFRTRGAHVAGHPCDVVDRNAPVIYSAMQSLGPGFNGPECRDGQ